MDGRLCGARRASGSFNDRLSVRAKPPARESRVACDIFWAVVLFLALRIIQLLIAAKAQPNKSWAPPNIPGCYVWMCLGPYKCVVT